MLVFWLIYSKCSFSADSAQFCCFMGCSSRNLQRHDQQLMYKNGFQKLKSCNVSCVFSPHSEACQHLMQMHLIILQTQTFKGIPTVRISLAWWGFPLLHIPETLSDFLQVLRENEESLWQSDRTSGWDKQLLAKKQVFSFKHISRGSYFYYALCQYWMKQ